MGFDIHNQNNILYAGFWRRLGAHFLDLIILFPLGYIVFLGENQSRLFSIYFFLPWLLFILWFHIYLVCRYGGTPGKLLLKIRIVKLDGARVGYKEAILRSFVLIFLSVVVSIAEIVVVLGMTDKLYFSMEWMVRIKYIRDNMPTWYSPVKIVLNIWVWSEFIVMLTNRKRRALHDYMAGTIVRLK